MHLRLLIVRSGIAALAGGGLMSLGFDPFETVSWVIAIMLLNEVILLLDPETSTQHERRWPRLVVESFMVWMIAELVFLVLRMHMHQMAHVLTTDLIIRAIGVWLFISLLYTMFARLHLLFAGAQGEE